MADALVGCKSDLKLAFEPIPPLQPNWTVAVAALIDYAGNAFWLCFNTLTIDVDGRLRL